MKRLSRYFLQGLLFMVPLVLTLYVFYFLFIKIDGLIKIPLPGIGVVPGVGFIATILIIVLVGFLVSNFLTKKFFIWVDVWLNKVPLFKLLYGSVKDLLGAFVGNKKSFTQPVLVRICNEDSAHVLGFITCDTLSSFGLAEYVAVYVPQSYNFAGQLLIFPSEQVQLLPASSTDIMTFIVSGGVAASGNGNKMEPSCSDNSD